MASALPTIRAECLLESISHPELRLEIGVILNSAVGTTDFTARAACRGNAATAANDTDRTALAQVASFTQLVKNVLVPSSRPSVRSVLAVVVICAFQGDLPVAPLIVRDHAEA